MPKVTLFNQTGSQVGDIELNESIFGIEPNNHVLFEAIIMQRASLRQGTHKVKNRSEVAGGGRKPWKQKGTGRARQGSIRSPQWRGGGKGVGPKTKEFVAVLKGLSIETKALIVTGGLDEKVALSARNIPGVTVVEADGLNVLDVVSHNKLIMTKSA